MAHSSGISLGRVALVACMSSVAKTKVVHLVKVAHVPSPTDSHTNVTMANAGVESLQRYTPYEPRMAETLEKSSFASNSQPLRSIGAVYYVGPIEVGAQMFRVVYDTGSNLLWVPSQSCGDTCVGHPAFQGKTESLDEEWSVSYGSGPVEGTYVRGPVSIAGANLTSFKMGLAGSVGFEGFEEAEFDGLLGLAWESLQGMPSFVPALYAAVQIPANLFTLYLTPDGSGGELSLGEIDNSRLHGEIYWLPLVVAQWWTIRLDQVRVDDVVVSDTSRSAFSDSSKSLAILDSGTSLISGPHSLIMKIINAIYAKGIILEYDNQTGFFAIWCSSVASLPTISFTLSGSDYVRHQYVIPGSAYVVQALSADPAFCTLGIDTLRDDSGVDWILGDSFLRSFYSIYDYANERVGLAVATSSKGSIHDATDIEVSGLTDAGGWSASIVLFTIALFAIV